MSEITDVRFKNCPFSLQVTTSKGEKVDLRQLKHRVLPKIENLPKKEKGEILEKWLDLRRWIGKNLANKTDAYGVRETDKAWQKKEEIIELFGRMFDEKEIKQILSHNYEINVSIPFLKKFKSRFREIIGNKIDDHKNSVDSLRLTHKRSRIEELTDIYYIEKSEYRRKPQTNRAMNMARILGEVRHEMEGHQININLKGEIELKAAVNEHLAREAFKRINIQQLILARVAAKNNLNPLVLQQNLASGYYSVLQKAVDNDDLGELESFQYPSERNYDIMELESKVKQKEQDYKKKREETVKIDESKVRKVEGLKSSILANIEKAQGKVRKQQQVVDVMSAAKSLKPQKKPAQKDEGITQKKKKSIKNRLSKSATGKKGDKVMKKNIRRIVKSKRKPKK